MTPSPSPILLFGATTATGAAFLELAAARPVLVAGRRLPPGWPADRFLPIDLKAAATPPVGALPDTSLLVSFAPIWLLAPFLATLHHGLAGLGRPCPIAALEVRRCIMGDTPAREAKLMP